MSTETATYRWNTSAAAEAYDAAAPVIHPVYEKVQDEILRLIASAGDQPLLLVDLGAGSGRLAEKALAKFPSLQAVLVDQSEPFLALAERRVKRFGSRARIVSSRLQDDWPALIDVSPDLIVSTSAIHHLEPHEKQALFSKCFTALKPGGRFINGDEYRPADDGAFRDLLEGWSAHMKAAMDSGRIPETFRATLDQWYKRNVTNFGAAKKSGDDCQETIEAQAEYLRDVGFERVETVWAERLWGVVCARKA